MQPIRHEPEFVQGLEILNFPNVELDKVKQDGNSTFSTTGDLSIIYFDYYERFMLQLGNWRYCLLPRLPANSLTDSTANYYEFPAYDGIYSVKLPNQFSPIAMQNLETILTNTTKFNEKKIDPALNMQQIQLQQPGYERVTTVVESTIVPADGILRETQPTLVQSVERVQPSLPQQSITGEPPVNYHAGSGQFGGYYQRTGQVVNIGNTGFDDSKPKKKKFRDRMSKVFKKKAKNPVGNPNMMEVRDFLRIKATDETMVPTIDFKREEIEAVIVSAKEIARMIENPAQEEMREKVMGVVESIKEGVHDIKEKIMGEAEEVDPLKPSLRKTFFEGLTELREKIQEEKASAGTGSLRNAIMVASAYEGMKQIMNNLKETAADKSRYQSAIDKEKRDMQAAIPAPYHTKHPLSQQQYGENVSPYDRHIGMRNIMREEYQDVREKIEHRKEITGNVGGSLEKAFVAATIFDGAKDVSCRLFHEGKYKIDQKLHGDKEEEIITEYIPREPLSKRKIVTDGYEDVKYKIEHRKELTGNVGGSVEKAFVASTVFEGAKDVTCSLFNESKAEVQDTLKRRKYEKQFEPEKPSLGVRIKEGALELKQKIVNLTQKDHSVEVIEGAPIVRESTILVQSGDPNAPEYHTRVTKTVVYSSRQLDSAGTETLTQSQAARIGPIRDNRSHSPVSKREIVFASLPVFFGGSKKTEDEKIPSEKVPDNRDFIDKVRDSLHKLGDKLRQYPRYDHDSDITATKDVDFAPEMHRKGSFSEKLKDKIENTAVQIPEYEPEVFVDPARLIDYDRQGVQTVGFETEKKLVTSTQVYDTPTTGIPSTTKVLKSRILSVKPITGGTPFSGTSMSGTWKATDSTASGFPITENIVTSQVPAGNYVSRNLENELKAPESQVISSNNVIDQTQSRVSNLSNSSQKQVYEPMYYTEG